MFAGGVKTNSNQPACFVSWIVPRANALDRVLGVVRQRWGEMLLFCLLAAMSSPLVW